MLNIENVNDSIMKGQTRFARWQRKFKEEFNAPTIRQMKMGVWKSSPAEFKEMLRIEKPDLYKMMNEKYGG